MTQIKRFSFMTVKLIVNFRVIFVFEAVAMNIWWLLEKLHGSQFAYSLVILDIAFPRQRPLFLSSQQLVFKLDVGSCELIPS